MPLLFAATLFVSASLLFMVQPMVAKMVLPLLGGSPAVWNACMVFFQLLLLLGYQYAHFVTGKYTPRRQWLIHLVLLAAPMAAFALSTMFGSRRTPIAIAESLAPSDESSPVLAVMLLLTVAIGIPFFVVSTSAPLLQKWFAATGHPSARDPYFLYSASNAGSLISLLGYPLVIEPNLSIAGQAWLFAVGFGLLSVMVFFCGQAAANPIGVPPTGGRLPADKAGTKSAQKSEATQTASGAHLPEGGDEAPPTLVRKLKWIALAFVPSSLMLGVTFHMTTDIASIPLLWVGPLSLYLITFIIAFGRVPDWFRVVVGNLAPVMILLLVFVMLSKVRPGTGIELLLYNLTFFAAALMCHYELARDRPSPQYLTEFFLLMSVGGVLGGIFNSLVAPVVFTHAYEFPLVLVVACMLVPRLTDEPPAEEGAAAVAAAPKPPLWEQGVALVVGALLAPVVVLAEAALAILGMKAGGATPPEAAATNPAAGSNSPAAPAVTVPPGVGIAALAAFLGLGGYLLFGAGLPARYAVPLVMIAFVALSWPMLKPVEEPFRRRWERIGDWRRVAMLNGAVPVVVGVGFYLLVKISGEGWFLRLEKGISDGIKVSPDTTEKVLIFAVPVMVCFFFVDRPLRFALCVAAILGYRTYAEASDSQMYAERSFFGILKIEKWEERQRPVIRDEDGNFVAAGGLLEYHRLVHGTTLHGTQIYKMENNVCDMFQCLTALNPWDNIAVAGANHSFTVREEPLTYYHRSGPVGAMFAELRSRDGGKYRTADAAMVGLGTGSASCYALPGQRLTFYEIDPAVKRLVADTDKYFTYYQDAVRRGAKMDIRMGDARLKLKQDSDRRYALLLVDAFSSDSIPVHLLTKESVQLYLDRMTDDGILALHISNKFVKLEPVVSAIAKDLNLVARVWNDEAERRPGKTASSWVVLAREAKHLGNLYSPIGDLPFALQPDSDGDELVRRVLIRNAGREEVHTLFDLPIVDVLELDYKKEMEEKDKPDGKSKAEQLNTAEDKRKAWLDWIAQKIPKATSPREKARLELCAALIDEYGPFTKLSTTIHDKHGHGFRKLETLHMVEPWTDDYADVMRVMMLSEVKWLRRQFGLPALD